MIVYRIEAFLGRFPIFKISRQKPVHSTLINPWNNIIYVSNPVLKEMNKEINVCLFDNTITIFNTL